MKPDCHLPVQQSRPSPVVSLGVGFPRSVARQAITPALCSSALLAGVTNAVGVASHTAGALDPPAHPAGALAFSRFGRCLLWPVSSCPGGPPPTLQTPASSPSKQQNLSP